MSYVRYKNISVIQYYSLLSVLRISSTWALTNNSLKHVHVCHSLKQPLYSNISLVPSGERIRAVAWSCLRSSTIARYRTKGEKLPPFLCKIFNDDPQFFCTFSVEPLVVYNCVLYNLKVLHRFWDIRLVSIQWPWNPGYGSLKVIENYTIRSGTHDFLLTFHSNHRPISHRFRDKRRFPSKVGQFSYPPCISRPHWRRSPWNLVSAQGVTKASMTGLPDGRKSFKIDLFV